MNPDEFDEYDQLPIREAGPIRRMGYNAKTADGPRTEYASEFRRFLNSRVGELWDEVYSEMCMSEKDMLKWARKNLDIVYLNCHIQDGRVYDSQDSLMESRGRDEFYVLDGILYKAPQRPRYIHHKRVLPEEGLNYYEINGAFFEVHFRKFAGFTGEALRLPIFTGYDVLSKQRLTWRDCEVRYGGLISWKKRQLSKREIRRLGLRPN